MRRLIEAVLEDKNNSWSDETNKQFVIDANAILEALLLEYGISAALDALVKQGFSPKGNYRYAAEPLYGKAVERRERRQSSRTRTESGAEI